MKSVLAAALEALDRVLHDPGTVGPKLKTGQVIVSPTTAPRIDDLVAIIRENLPPARYVEHGTEQPPAERVRALNRLIEERWEAVPAPVSGSVAEIAAQLANGIVPIAGWRVTQHIRHLPRSWAGLSGEEIRQLVMSLQQAPQDDATYNGLYPTLPGDAVIHHNPAGVGTMREFQDGKPLYDRAGNIARGGREIRGGRAEHRRVIKELGYVEVGPGWQADVDRIKREQKEKRRQQGRDEVERVIAQAPPRNPFDV